MVAQNPTKFKNMSVTGVLASKCGWHDLFIRGSVVDLQRGEWYVIESLCVRVVLSWCNYVLRFINADYALARSIQPYVGYPYLLVSYDIACQYSKNVARRFSKAFGHELVDLVSQAIFTVLKLHCQGHKDNCQYRFSLNYIEHAGWMAGELIETAWAEANNIRPSMREMTPGHRHDVLNDLYDFWN